MLEVEMKFPIGEFTALEARLHDWGARQRADVQEADHYFNAPDRDFARTDEALRLRCIGPANFVTYKGPKRDRQTKTRTEIEVPLAEGSPAAEGFRCCAGPSSWLPDSTWDRSNSRNADHCRSPRTCADRRPSRAGSRRACDKDRARSWRHSPTAVVPAAGDTLSMWTYMRLLSPSERCRPGPL